MHRLCRRIAALLVGAVLCAACSPNTPPPDAATPDAPTPLGGGDPVTITLGAEEQNRAVLEPLLDAFNRENPDVRARFVPVSLSGSSMDEVDQRFREMVGTVDAAFTGVRPAYIDQGLLLNLRPLLEADASFGREDFFPGTLQEHAPGGGIYQVPSSLHIPLLIYNKDLFQRRGVGEPSPSWTWADLRSMAQQLARKQGGRVESYGLMDWDTGAVVLRGELAEAGVRLSDPADAAADLRLDNPQIAQVFDHVRRLADEGAIYAPASSDPQVSQADRKISLITGGGVGVWSSALSPLSRAAPSFRFQTGLAVYPARDDVAPFYTQGYTISAGTSQPQETWRLIAFLSRQPGPAGQIGAGSSTISVPARRSVVQRSGTWGSIGAEQAALAQAVLDRPISSQAASEGSWRIEAALAQALQHVIDGAEPATALAEAQSALEQQIAQAGPTATIPTPLPVLSPTEAVPDEGGVAITFDTWQGDAEQLRGLAAQFQQQHPDIVVNLRSSSRFEPVQAAEVASRADCYVGYAPLSTRDTQPALDLQPLLDSDPGFALDDYPPALLEPLRREGRVRGLPYRVTLRQLNYNPALFDAIGLGYPTADWTLDDLANAAQRLTGGSERDRRYGFASLNRQNDLLFFLARTQAELVRREGNSLRPNFTDPNVVQALRVYLDLLVNFAPPQSEIDPSAAGSPFELVRQGRVGMWLGFGAFSSTTGEPPAVAPPPLGQGALASTDVQLSSALYISSASAYPQQCWEWLTFLSESPLGLEGGFPARRSVAESPAFVDRASRGSAALYAAYRDLLARPLERSFAGVPVPGIDPYWLFQALDRARQGESLERELATAQATTERYLDCMEAGGPEGPQRCARQADPDYQGQNLILPLQ
ncbi:MAG TPA: extracellular solute-binding protein [Roseiflexaceae bacterium]|nr:extracellular solute-binding protein [Roseiflexaceae bacterium]